MVEKVLLASPRGYCAGVERAVETVERALELYGPPVFVRKQIVHNAHVVRDLEQRGAVFVDDERDAPVGATPPTATPSSSSATPATRRWSGRWARRRSRSSSWNRSRTPSRCPCRRVSGSPTSRRRRSRSTRR